MRFLALGLGLCFALPVMAQDDTDAEQASQRVNKSVETTSSAQLRVIDRVAGRSEIVTASAGQSIQIFDSVVYASLVECRYFLDNPSGEAFAFLEITDAVQAKQLFFGWMIASSPALNALEHNRYDVWPLRCSTS